MTCEPWVELLKQLDGDRRGRCLLLDPTSTRDDIVEAERALGTAVPPVVEAVLMHWNEQGSDLLLSILPHLLNPFATDAELEPTGISMRGLFPEFCQMLDKTKHFAVIIDPPSENDLYPLNILCAGLGHDLIPAIQESEPAYWAFYLPQPLETIVNHESKTGVKLSPQLKQMFLRANGAPDLICPYFFPLEWLNKGSLADLYREFWTELDSPEPFERLEAFVSFYEDGSGNYQGFFPDERVHDGEHTIYDWDHETVRFSEWAPDFASWLKRILVQGW